MELLEKIEKLKSEYTFEQDKAVMTSLSKRVRSALVKQGVAKSDGIKLALEEINNKIKDISYLICFSKDLEEKERQRLFQQREDYQWFVSFFQPEKDIKFIEEYINKELE
jgi:transcriptional regulatory protein LevR